MKKILFIISLVFITSCTDPYLLQTTTYNDALVVEANITNELKHQEVLLSRTYKLEENGPKTQSNATVYIVDSNGITYPFEEINDKYISEQPFSAQSGITYQLFIKIGDKNYTSTPVKLTTVTELDSINVNKTTHNGDVGVEITANSFDPSNSSFYYRYTYDETYKVIAPLWSAYVLKININDEYYLEPRIEEARTCYSNNKSTSIILSNTKDLSEDRNSNFRIRFIPQNNYIIANRYSILVTQYVHNYEAYTFYNTLSKLSSTESLLSQMQPGFFFGNIKCIENPSEKVVGLFDVCTSSSKRLFFNYVDIFPGEPFPDYLYECDMRIFDVSNLDPLNLHSGFFGLKNNIQTGNLIYYSHDDVNYELVTPECGDCTTYSSNIIPSFWE